MKKVLLISLILCGGGLVDTRQARAQSPEVVAAVEAAPAAVGVGRDVLKLSAAAADLLRLPLGLAEIALSPLPGISVIDGAVNIVRGTLAPLECGICLLQLPVRLAKHAGRLAATPGLP